MRRDLKLFRRFFDIIRMAHPADCHFRYAFEQSRICIDFYFCPAVFTDRRCSDFSAEQICHKLRAITDSQNRDSQLKYFFSTNSSALTIYAVRPTSKNNAFWLHLPDFLQADIIRMDFAVYVTFPDSSGNQLIILPTKV